MRAGGGVEPDGVAWPSVAETAIEKATPASRTPKRKGENAARSLEFLRMLKPLKNRVVSGMQ